MSTLIHYRGGAIFTSDTQPWAESIVVEDGRIAYVGDTATADALPVDEVVELDGAVMLPGIVDAHTHLVGMGESLTQIDLQDAEDLADIQGRLRDAAASAPGTERMIGRSWLFSALDGRPPHRDMIDAVVSDRPVYLNANDSHSAWVNSAALAELGIDDDTPDPLGGTIERDAAGHATGMLRETAALGLMRDRLDELVSDAAREDALRAAFDRYLAAGVTAAVDMALGEPELRALVAVQTSRGGSLPMRVAAHWVVDRTGTPEGDLAGVARAIELAAEHAGPWLRVTGIKLFVDGVIDSCTAAMRAPFADGSHPEALWDLPSLSAVVTAADAAGLQVAMHAIGDAASALALDALDAAVAANGPRADRRHRIEHLETVDAATPTRLARLGVIASVQPVHSDPAIQENWRAMLGDARVERGFPWGELADAGATLALGTDAPTAPYDPLANLYIAATRKSAFDRSLPPNIPRHAMAIADAVRRATRDAAYAARWDGELGVLRRGAAADFFVIDVDPFRDGADVLLDSAVRFTVLAGEVVHSAAALRA
ncbi:amidohydrolase [Microbacterium rhizosphaerae]|uniref:Amidohydrolase n=1 Tax=Microbacterium rhizosphaerae TaxID=1678237 RepID=A0ABZ0SNW4_9MICO|nr:amidohydrolase [Microbacterium rhizosphaerae]WPR89508.1 amidohydrolase [Microbacterium rhizosphaerae]